MKLLTGFLTFAFIASASLLLAEEQKKQDQPKPAATEEKKADTPAQGAEAKKDQPAKTDDKAAAEARDAKPELEPYEAEITGARVNIRSGPSTNYRSLLRAKKGFGVLAFGLEGEWIKIAVPNECLLWIKKNYVKVYESGGRGMVTGEKVSVRMLPEAEADIVGQVTAGTELEITGGEGEWLEIAPPPTTFAYVHKDYLKRVEVAEPQQEEPQKTEPATTEPDKAEPAKAEPTKTEPKQ